MNSAMLIGMLHSYTLMFYVGSRDWPGVTKALLLPALPSHATMPHITGRPLLTVTTICRGPALGPDGTIEDERTI